jgi:hypothetical protein
MKLCSLDPTNIPTAFAEIRLRLLDLIFVLLSLLLSNLNKR